MNSADKKDFANYMARMQEVFTPNHPISKIKMDTYFNLFQDVSIADFQRACYNVMQTKTISTFPLPGELRDALGRKDRPLEAWLEARVAVTIYGHNYSIRFQDPIIHSVIEALGGWVEFCSFPKSENTWREKDFKERYKVMIDRKHHPEYLPGAHEIQNTGLGFKDNIQLIALRENSIEKLNNQLTP